MPLRSICCSILWNDVQVKLQKSSQVLLLLLLLFLFPPPVLQSPRGFAGSRTLSLGSWPMQEAESHRLPSGFPGRALGQGWGGKQGGSCCQQFPLFSDLLRLKVTHSLASWGISFEVSFSSLPEAGFRPPPCFSYVIPWITVNIDNITLGTQRGKLKTTWMPYIQVFLFFQELSQTSIFTVA